MSERDDGDEIIAGTKVLTVWWRWRRRPWYAVHDAGDVLIVDAWTRRSALRHLEWLRNAFPAVRVELRERP